MRHCRRQSVPILTPAAVLAFVAVAPLMLAGDGAYKACPMRSSVRLCSVERAESFVQCVHEAARELFKRPVAVVWQAPAYLAVRLAPYPHTSAPALSDSHRGFDLPVALTDLPPPL